MSLIFKESQEMIGTITFNNPVKRNSLSNDMLNEMVDAFVEFREQKARAVIIRAEKGARIWSSGLDVTELPDPGRDPLSYYDPLERVLRQIQNFPAPVLALVEGSVFGGACDLAFTCDIVIGSPTAAFAITPAKLGVPYNISGILHFVNIVGLRLAHEMFFTAQPVDADRALFIGILNHLKPADEIEKFTYEMANQICCNSPLSISVIKEQLRLLGNSYPLSPDTFERIQGLRRRAYDSADYREGKEAFLEKRKPHFTGE